MTARNKFGVHYVVDGSHDWYGADLERCAAAGQPFGLVKSFFDKGALGQAKSVSQNTYTIYRVCIDDDRDFPATENGSWCWPNAAACKASAIDWVHKCDELWKAEREKVNAFELVNEPNPTDEKIYWFIEWSRYCLDEAERLGYRLAWGGFSTGTPTESQMKEMLPFAAELALRGHILAMHDGAVVEPFTFQGTATDPNSPIAASSLRYRWWKHQADLQSLPFPEVAITECYAYGKKGTAFYDDWQWYLTELAKDDYLIGVAWYTLGEGGAFGNIAGKPMQLAVDRALAIDYGTIEPPVPPPPPEETQLVLQVPFTSQVGATTPNACGPACCAIVEGYLSNVGHTTQEWYEASGAGTGLITIPQLQLAAQRLGYNLQRFDGQSLGSLMLALAANALPILLVNSAYLDNCATATAHFIVPVGFEFDGSAFYVHDPYTVRGKGGAFVRQTNLNAAWGNCHLQGNSDYVMLILEKGTEPPIPPVSTALNGVGMGDLATLTSPELDALKAGKVTAFKALTLQHPPDNAMLLQQVRSVNPNMFIMARLMFSPDWENKTRFTPQMFVDYVKEPALTMYTNGVRYFEIGNEPNLIYEGWDWNWKNGVEFGEWFDDVFYLLHRFMPSALLGFPGLSPQVDNIANVCEASNLFMEEARKSAGAADFICCHSYFQGRGTGHWQLFSEDYGGWYYRVIQRMFPNKPLYITEYSCNNPGVSDADKGKIYAEYLSTLAGVQAAFSFCLSWQNDPNRESWVRNSSLTEIPQALGSNL